MPFVLKRAKCSHLNAGAVKLPEETKTQPESLKFHHSERKKKKKDFKTQDQRMCKMRINNMFENIFKDEKILSSTVPGG